MVRVWSWFLVVPNFSIFCIAQISWPLFGLLANAEKCFVHMFSIPTDYFLFVIMSISVHIG